MMVSSIVLMKRKDLCILWGEIPFLSLCTFGVEYYKKFTDPSQHDEFKLSVRTPVFFLSRFISPL